MKTKSTIIISVIAALLWLLGAIAVNSPVFVSANAQGPKVIDAQQFRVIDSSGTVRALLTGANPQSHTVLSLKDKKGIDRVEIWVHPNGAHGISFIDGHGNSTYLTPLKTGQRLSRLTSSDSKADSARPEDIRYLQSQIDALSNKVNQLVDAINQLSD